MKFHQPALFLAAALTFGGCTSHTNLAPEICQLLTTEYDQQEVVLNHSMYYGPMYDDERFLLLSEWPFDNTSLLSDSHGQPLTPGHGRDLDIIPIGTHLKILRLEFPDKENFGKRLLYTPRYHPWVIVKVLDQDPFLPKKPMVITLPIEIASKEQADMALAYYFGNEEEIQKYLEGLPEPIRVAVANKEVIRGMNYEQVTRALGKPLAVDDLIKDGHTTRTLTYGAITVKLIDNKVIAPKPMKNSRPGYHNPTL